MSILSSIINSILGKDTKTSTAQTTSTTSASAPSSITTPANQSGKTLANVDVDAILSDLASKNSEKLNWKTSIVDLMKLLDLDSSLTARKKLAEELKYTGDTNDSATMNIWLQKQVLAKLAENGGKLPADIKAA